MVASSHLKEFKQWRESVVRDSSFECQLIPFADSRQWRFEDGALKHRSGGFFSVVGLRSSSRHLKLNGIERIIILQPEIAINGFLVRHTPSGTEILCQGRVEPGNIEVMQLAPTIQSTDGNIKRLHGGAAPPLVEWFTEKTAARMQYDGLQSEEGSRYYGKYNRNVVFEITSSSLPELPSNFRWFTLDAVREMVASSNVFNTDARSVLSCMDWEFLRKEGSPFQTNDTSGFGHKLYESYTCKEGGIAEANLEIFHWLGGLRAFASIRQQLIAIDQVSGWSVTASTIEETTRRFGFTVRQFSIQARGREVSSWDQPLVDSDGVGIVALLCQVRDGVLRFLIKANYELGYLEGVQLSTTIAIPPGEQLDTEDSIQRNLYDMVRSGERCSVKISCRQSEEGGRFYQDENEYSVIELDPGVELELSEDYRWLTLKQVKGLIRTSGVFAIEFRDTITLLLKYI